MPEEARYTAQEIARAVRSWPDQGDGNHLPDDGRESLAKAVAAQSRQTPVANTSEPIRSTIFVVHGHDEDFLRDVTGFISSLGIEPIIMKDIGSATASLLQRFFEVGGAAQFAVVLLSADDLGASLIQYEHPRGGAHALKFRARQNVILELGFFYGRFGWENVFVLEKAALEPFPDFERPSDLNGPLFDRYDETGQWRTLIHRKLLEAGFNIDAIQ